MIDHLAGETFGVAFIEAIRRKNSSEQRKEFFSACLLMSDRTLPLTLISLSGVSMNEQWSTICDSFSSLTNGRRSVEADAKVQHIGGKTLLHCTFPPLLQFKDESRWSFLKIERISLELFQIIRNSGKVISGRKKKKLDFRTPSMEKSHAYLFAQRGVMKRLDERRSLQTMLSPLFFKTTSSNLIRTFVMTIKWEGALVSSYNARRNDQHTWLFDDTDGAVSSCWSCFITHSSIIRDLHGGLLTYAFFWWFALPITIFIRWCLPLGNGDSIHAVGFAMLLMHMEISICFSFLRFVFRHQRQNEKKKYENESVSRENDDYLPISLLLVNVAHDIIKTIFDNNLQWCVLRKTHRTIFFLWTARKSPSNRRSLIRLERNGTYQMEWKTVAVSNCGGQSNSDETGVG